MIKELKKTLIFEKSNIIIVKNNYSIIYLLSYKKKKKNYIQVFTRQIIMCKIYYFK